MVQTLEIVADGSCAHQISFDRYTLPTLTIAAEQNLPEEVQFLAKLLKTAKLSELNQHFSTETVIVDKNFVPRMIARLQEAQ